MRFTIELKLQGVVARTNDDGRRLSADDGFDGSASNVTSSFTSDLSSKVHSHTCTQPTTLSPDEEDHGTAGLLITLQNGINKNWCAAAAPLHLLLRGPRVLAVGANAMGAAATALLRRILIVVVVVVVLVVVLVDLRASSGDEQQQQQRQWQR